VMASLSPSENVRGIGMCGYCYKYNGCMRPYPTGITSIESDDLLIQLPWVVCVLTVFGLAEEQGRVVVELRDRRVEYSCLSD
jgi:hypothetical protein